MMLWPKTVNNIFKTDYAEYDKKLKLLISKGKTEIITSEGYSASGSNVSFDNKKKFIFSKDPAPIEDPIKIKFIYKTLNI